MGNCVSLNRTTFETSRAAEYFDVKELQAQTGQSSDMFPAVVLKELVDNALDACESDCIAPVIDINTSVSDGIIHISVQDNAGGISPDTIDRILNFDTRTSDKAAYRSPTRGAQGNALKTVLGIPNAMGSKEPIVIKSKGICHSIRVWIDPAGELRIEHDKENIPTEGTLIDVTINRAPLTYWDDDPFDPVHWARGFALFNPHATVNFSTLGTAKNNQAYSDGETSNSYHSTVSFPGEWRKFLPSDLTSIWWYSVEDLQKLIFSHIAETRRSGRDLTLREFVRQFRSLSGTSKAKTVCDQFPDISRLSDFENESNYNQIRSLSDAMRMASSPPAPTVLGLIGEDHFKSCFDNWYGIRPGRFWYVKKAGPAKKDRENGEIPYVFEVAIAETERNGDLFTGLNFSPTYEDFLAVNHLATKDISGQGIVGFLQNRHIEIPEPDNDVTFAVAVHLTCPALEFLDRGKTRLNV